MEPNDVFSVKLISGITASNDDTYFSVVWVEDNEYRSSIFKQGHQGVKRVTFGGKERIPLFHDKSLYYISSKNGSDRVLKLGEVSEPQSLCSFRNISSFVPYKNGILTVVGENFKSTRPFIIKRLKYKHDSTGLLRRRRTLYYTINGESRRIVSGSYDVVDVNTNDNRVVISCSNINDDYSLTDLYDLDVETGELVKITKGRGSIEAFDVSPNGTIAYVGHRNGARDWSTRKIYLPELGEQYLTGMISGNFVSTDLFDDSTAELQWDGEILYVIGQTGGVTSLYRVEGGSMERITDPDVSVRHFNALGGNIAYSTSTTRTPSVLVSDHGSYDPNEGYSGRDSVRITDSGVEGWIILVDRESPSILFIHGGPHGAYGPVFNMEMQYFASLGYNIIYCNPRGSLGYGEEYAKGTIGAWGSGDALDILTFTANMTEQFGLQEKIGVKGVSYGGYMVNWLVTQTDRFSAAVSEKGVSNLLSSCGTSDIGYWFDAPEEIGNSDPWSQESVSEFMKKSPITFVKNVKTPTLLIHGEEDHRCPIEQSEQFFTALKFYGIDTVFVRLQGESHELANRDDPSNRAESLEIKRDWFNRHLKGIPTDASKS